MKRRGIPAAGDDRSSGVRAVLSERAQEAADFLEEQSGAEPTAIRSLRFALRRWGGDLAAEAAASKSVDLCAVCRGQSTDALRCHEMEASIAGLCLKRWPVCTLDQASSSSSSSSSAAAGGGDRGGDGHGGNSQVLADYYHDALQGPSDLAASLIQQFAATAVLDDDDDDDAKKPAPSPACFFTTLAPNYPRTTHDGPETARPVMRPGFVVKGGGPADDAHAVLHFPRATKMAASTTCESRPSVDLRKRPWSNPRLMVWISDAEKEFAALARRVVRGRFARVDAARAPPPKGQSRRRRQRVNVGDGEVVDLTGGGAGGGAGGDCCSVNADGKTAAPAAVAGNATMCVVCRAVPSSYAIIPCGHKVCCADCWIALRHNPAFDKCPYCNQKYTGALRIFD